MKTNILTLTLMAVLMTAAIPAVTSCKLEGGEPFDNTTVATLDLDRYTGGWFEIARYDHRFERGLTNVMARYGKNDNGTLSVTNTGWKDGIQSSAEGKARTTDKPGLLRVSFFGPFYSDYRVLFVDEGYTYALVGSGSRGYLWILCRTPRLTDEAKATLLGEMSRRGYDEGDLIWVEQSRNLKMYNF